MKRSTVAELEYLNELEKELVEDVRKMSREQGIRLYLIGSKARGDFKETSDIDIIALYEEDNASIDEVARELIDYVLGIKDKHGVTISYMLFPESIEYCDEEEAEQEYGAYSWIPTAIKNDGVYLRKSKN